jgi:uncharacterized protein YlaI
MENEYERVVNEQTHDYMCPDCGHECDSWDEYKWHYFFCPPPEERPEEVFYYPPEERPEEVYDISNIPSDDV